jgi:hypothetical protein
MAKEFAAPDEVAPRLAEDETARIYRSIRSFPHTVRRDNPTIGGVDGSGDFPALTCGDSFVYFTVAQATCYRSDTTSRLRAVAPSLPPVFEFAWLPESEEARLAALNDAFEKLSGLPAGEVITRSDYRQLKSQETRRPNTVVLLREDLLRPHAADSGNAIAGHFIARAAFRSTYRCLPGRARPARDRFRPAHSDG